MLVIQRPTIEAIGEPENNRQRFAVGPLEPGFGHTIGNSLRRTLLSSIPGAAITTVRFEAALHEFDTIEGIAEDITEIILNLKDIVVVSESDEPVVLRFARLEFVRGEWRRYFQDLTQPGLSVQTDPNLTSFNIAALNIEENAQRQPINYVVPPGIDREIDPSQVYQRQMNEQSLVLEVCNLQDGDARAAYRNVQFDVRTYKKLKMFVHADSVVQNQLKDNELTVFVRLGTDYVDNYYEYELPMKVTDWNITNPDLIWPEGNNIEIEFDRLLALKMERNTKLEQGVPGVSSIIEYEKVDPNNPNNRIKVKGSPNLQGVKTIMIGVRNPSKSDPDNTWGPDNGDAECVNVWVNEMRLTDFVSDGGSAAVSQMQLQLADFATVQAAGNYSGINWGAVDSRVQDRQRNQRMGADISTTMQLGQFFGKQARVSLPFYYGYSFFF